MSDIDSIPRIHKLSATLASQISAGEVVERPVSVIKELLENSLDAAASEVVIDIEGVGSGLIRVRDNGQGIHPDDLPLALDRHATSKLTTIDDLGQIVSLGFRGEALPSIASVSRFSIVSRTSGHDQAWMMSTDAVEKAPASHPIGTTVEVRDLFYNTPARRKFLKSDKTEFLHIQSLLKALALSAVDTSFKLRNRGTPVLNYARVCGNLEQRVAEVVGQKFIKNSLPIERRFESMRLSGWIGAPQLARSQTDRQFFYVNGRLIRDKNIIHAIRMAYQDKIHQGRFPCYVLYIEMDPSMVDVNVHPVKHEVRFQKVRDVHDLVFGALTEALENQRLFENPSESSSKVKDSSFERAHYSGSKHAPANFSAKPLLRLIKASRFRETELDDAPSNKMILQNDRYLLLQLGEKIILIDVFGARETIAAFHLDRYIRTDGVEIRTLLVPANFTLPEEKLDFAVTRREEIKSLGFELEQTGPNMISLKGFPALLPYADLMALLIEVIDLLMAEKNTDMSALSVKISRLMARHANVSMPVQLDNEEIRVMLRDIKLIEQNSQNKNSFPWRYLEQSTWEKLLQNG